MGSVRLRREGRTLLALLAAPVRGQAPRLDHGTELAALLHRGAHVARAERLVRDFIRDLLAEGAEAGDLRNDVPPAELAAYCLHALAAAGSLPSRAAVRRLVAVTLAGLRPPR